MNLLNKLLNAFTFVHLVQLCCGRGYSHKRIIGGRVARPEEYPFSVYLRLVKVDEPYHPYFCGGSILNEQWILTAAHCIVDTRLNGRDPSVQVFPEIEHSLRQGSARSYMVQSIFVDDEYHEESNFIDISLLKLAERLPLSDKVSQISLPQPGEEYLYTNAEVIGYGYQKVVDRNQGTLDPDIFGRLMVANVELFRDENSPCAYEKVYNPSTMICAGTRSGSQDSCSGDSGSPLIARRADRTPVIIGIVSYGAINCGEPGKPGVYTRVSQFLDWIGKTMNEN